MAEPEVVRLAREYKAALLRQEQAQMEAMARRWLAVERRLQGQMDALALEMAQIKRDGGVIDREMLINQQRYRELMVQLHGELRTYSDYVQRDITNRQIQLARLGIAHAQNSIAAQGVSGGFNRLPVEAVDYLAGYAGNGKPLGQLLANSWPLSADGITQELINGVALGYNPRKTARMMAQGATGSLDRMMTIARTEQLRVYRVANLESYRASGVVNSYKRIAAHDSRVCGACLMAEGTTYQLDEFMPTHVSCRCTLIPVVDGVAAPTWTMGEEWFMAQSDATQKDILGTGRYYAWQNGDFNLADLVKVTHDMTWGDGLQVTPLKELVQ